MRSLAYAEYEDVIVRTSNEIDCERCTVLLEDAAAIIDAYNPKASETAKRLVSCNLVIRALGNNSPDIPMGATQGSMSGLGYSQSWTLSSGSVGEMYLTKLDKKLLGTGAKMGFLSPLEDAE